MSLVAFGANSQEFTRILEPTDPAVRLSVRYAVIVQFFAQSRARYAQHLRRMRHIIRAMAQHFFEQRLLDFGDDQTMQRHRGLALQAAQVLTNRFAAKLF
jgi:hypothetical protein